MLISPLPSGVLTSACLALLSLVVPTLASPLFGLDNAASLALSLARTADPPSSPGEIDVAHAMHVQDDSPASKLTSGTDPSAVYTATEGLPGVYSAYHSERGTEDGLTDDVRGMRGICPDLTVRCVLDGNWARPVGYLGKKRESALLSPPPYG
jgi:hypothetical protein